MMNEFLEFERRFKANVNGYNMFLDMYREKMVRIYLLIFILLRTIYCTNSKMIKIKELIISKELD